MYPVKARYKLAPSCSLLSAAEARKIETKEFPQRSQSQKLPLQGELSLQKRTDSTRLDLFISLYYHCKVAIITVVIITGNRTTMPDDPPLLKINE